MMLIFLPFGTNSKAASFFTTSRLPYSRASRPSLDIPNVYSVSLKKAEVVKNVKSFMGLKKCNLCLNRD